VCQESLENILNRRRDFISEHKHRSKWVGTVGAAATFLSREKRKKDKELLQTAARTWQAASIDLLNVNYSTKYLYSPELATLNYV
jgi:hypothetical protein